jgi:pre-mRNA-splicing factor 38A
MKHLRLLAAMFVRFTFPPERVYLTLEPLLCQYNLVAVLRTTGYELSHFDEVIHAFLREKFWCGITFPPLTPRCNLPDRISPLRHLAPQLRAEVFAELGMTPDGQLIEEMEEKKKLNVKGLRLKSRNVKKPKEKPKAEAADEIAEENKIRAMLGLPLLR